MEAARQWRASQACSKTICRSSKQSLSLSSGWRRARTLKDGQLVSWMKSRRINLHRSSNQTPISRRQVVDHLRFLALSCRDLSGKRSSLIATAIKSLTASISTTKKATTLVDQVEEVPKNPPAKILLVRRQRCLTQLAMIARWNLPPTTPSSNQKAAPKRTCSPLETWWPWTEMASFRKIAVSRNISQFPVRVVAFSSSKGSYLLN